MPTDPLVLAGIAALVVAALVLILRARSGGVTTVSSAPPPHAARSGVPGDADGQVQALLARGNKIGAIKLVREQTGLGLKEAKDYVEALEAGRALPPLPVGEAAAPLATGDLDVQVRALLAQASTIEAIKLVRERTGLGLKEAKDYVEALEAGRALPPLHVGEAVAPLAPGDLDSQVQALLAKNQKINAVKLVREQTGLGLKEAKDYVERFERR